MWGLVLTLKKDEIVSITDPSGWFEIYVTAEKINSLKGDVILRTQGDSDLEETILIMDKPAHLTDKIKLYLNKIQNRCGVSIIFNAPKEYRIERKNNLDYQLGVIRLC